MPSRSYSGSETSNNSNRDKELDERIKRWQNWKPPKISNKEIYKYNPFNPFNFIERIQTIEQTIKFTKTQQNIQLLDEKTIKELAKNFKYIHFALVQVTIKPLTRQGLHTTILACLRDARHLNFDDSLIGAIETSLCNGPVYFDGYPDLTISLIDKNILETLNINIKLHGYNMLHGSEIIAIIHHVHYKATNSICPKSLVNLLKGETTLMKCVTNDSNILIPQKIKWSDINILEDCSIQFDIISPNQENNENTSLHSITQNEEGLVKIRFDKTIKTHSTPEDLKEKSNYLNICDEKLDKNYQFQPHRASTSSIRFGKTNYFDTKTLLSEISSHLKKIINGNTNIKKVEEIFQNNKKEFKIFMNQKTTTTWITSNNKIIEAIHPPSEKIQINIQNNQIQAAPFKLQTSNNQITTNETNKIIEQNNYTNRHPQTLGSQLSRIENTIQNIKQNPRDEIKNQKIKHLFTPYKIPPSQIKQLTLNEINERLRLIIPVLQISLVNVTRGVTITSTSRTPHKDKNKIINVIQEIDTSSDDSVQEITKQLSSTKIDSLKIKSLTSYYYKPTYPDLQIEERGKFTQASYQSGIIYEWNIDGMNEYHIINKLQEMTMVSNAHKIRNDSDKAVVNILIAFFTGQIKCCWDNVFTTQQQTVILEVIQVNELKEPILDINNETIEDFVSTLIYNIANYFVGDPTYLKDRTADQLSNLRCRKLQDFRWYKETFMTKVLTREDANQPYWKEKFIKGLPTLFAEKIKNKYREKHKGVVPYEQLTYGDIVSTITKTGLEICYDIKMSKQIKKDSKTYKKDLGDFCTQFGYETFKPPPSKNLEKHKIDKKHYYKKQIEKPEYHRRPSKRKTHFKTNNFQRSNNDFQKTNHQSSNICYNCGRPGHIEKYCKIRKQIKKLDLSEDHRNQLFKIIDNQSPEESDYFSTSSTKIQAIKNSTSKSDPNSDNLNIKTYNCNNCIVDTTCDTTKN
ncbi:LOW QUALITY PROTEIN: MP domain-containing protein [Cephalotus follicularis]|uniref:MP domain-containing protein n=1 Tax=Cephalotus follicularis TaxID=3775 RepID=A0A1Q3C322_CEPFO|nr:LOW QUALITY PROTEIN: MP domain-containing protein [Cephalotus follicularis]